eukprot:1448115-Amphidinium_carterae.1
MMACCSLSNPWTIWARQHPGRSCWFASELGEETHGTLHLHTARIMPTTVEKACWLPQVHLRRVWQRLHTSDLRSSFSSMP